MENLKIGFLLHFYQPWWQFPSVLQKIAGQCYRPILELVNNTDGFCFTANVNLSLLELLENDFPDVAAGFRGAAGSGKIELMGSPAQHPIFPLIPQFLQEAQIEEDEKKKESRFSIKRNSKGFYLPEMAFSRNDIPVLKDYDYRWSVIDDEPYRAVNGSVPFDHIVIWNGFRIYMRSSLWSNRISSCRYSFSDIKTMMEHELPSWIGNAPAYIIIAMDAETFGHHCGCLVENLIEPMLNEWKGRIVPIESLGQSFPVRSVAYLPDGSWSTSADDMRRNDPYPLWNSRFNIYHSRLWELVSLALNHFELCRQDCLEMTSSCHWWWISSGHWEPEFMKKGAKRAFEVINKYGSSAEKERAENLYKKLKELH